MDQELAAESSRQPQPEPHIGTDGRLSYEKLEQVMDLAAKAGLLRIGCISDPSEARTAP